MCSNLTNCSKFIIKENEIAEASMFQLDIEVGRRGPMMAAGGSGRAAGLHRVRGALPPALTPRPQLLRPLSTPVVGSKGADDPSHGQLAATTVPPSSANPSNAAYTVDAGEE